MYESKTRAPNWSLQDVNKIIQHRNNVMLHAKITQTPSIDSEWGMQTTLEKSELGSRGLHQTQQKVVLE